MSRSPVLCPKDMGRRPAHRLNLRHDMEITNIPVRLIALLPQEITWQQMEPE
jgi:hypothetical protein